MKRLNKEGQDCNVDTLVLLLNRLYYFIFYFLSTIKIFKMFMIKIGNLQLIKTNNIDGVI